MRNFLSTLVFCISLYSQTIGQNLIVNGNFSNLYTGWTTGGSGWYITNTLNCFYTSPAYAFVGNSDGTGANNVSGYLSQAVTFPSNAYSVTLSFFYSITTNELQTTTNIYDSLEVFFYDNIHPFPLIVKLSNVDHTGSALTCNPYAEYTHVISGSELAQLSGLSVQLRFKVGNNTFNPTKFLIDNVSLNCFVCTPAQPGTISGNSAVCQNSAQTYSVNAVPDATSYTWSLPSGWTGSSTTNSINVTAGTTGGTISVTANDSCGSSPASTLNVTVEQPVSQAGSISGSPNVCLGSSQTYSISPVAGATSYTWTLPSGWLGNSVTSSISTTAGSNSGNISVSANNSCGSSSPQTMYLTSEQNLPQPGSISGNTTVCQNTVETYAVNPVSGATSYIWTLPSGWTGSSTSESIAASAGNYGGIIYVAAHNSCGNSNAQVLMTTVNTIDTSVSVAGYVLSSNAYNGTYKWVTCPAMQIIAGETSQSYAPSQSGSYAVIVTQNTCTDTSDCHQVLITGLSDINKTVPITIFPNPAHNSISIQCTKIGNNYNVLITNTLGQVLINKEINSINKSSESTIEISMLPNGIYFLNIISKEMNSVFKVQKL